MRNKILKKMSKRHVTKTPKCSYCKEDGHWMKHRDGRAICPKLREKEERIRRYKRENRRRYKVNRDGWTEKRCGVRKYANKKKEKKQPKRVNKFEKLAYDSDEETKNQKYTGEIPEVCVVSKPSGVWAFGVSSELKKKPVLKKVVVVYKEKSDDLREKLATAIRDRSNFERVCDYDDWADLADLEEMDEKIADLRLRLGIVD